MIKPESLVLWTRPCRSWIWERLGNFSGRLSCFHGSLLDERTVQFDGVEIKSEREKNNETYWRDPEGIWILWSFVTDCDRSCFPSFLDLKNVVAWTTEHFAKVTFLQNFILGLELDFRTTEGLRSIGVQ